MPQFIYTMKGLGKVYPPDHQVLKDIWLSFLPGPKIDDFPMWLISLMCLVTTASGAWVAWRLVELLREPAPEGAPDLGRVAAAATGAPYVRHPSHGGASAFASGLAHIVVGP